jgi:Rrf2 family protein
LPNSASANYFLALLPYSGIVIPELTENPDMPGLLNIPESMSIALHTCLWIANDDAGSFRPSPEIAKELGFSYNHFAKVVQRLVHAGVLETERGPKGGIRLAREPKSISLLHIYEATGGEPLSPHRCLLDPKICAGCACGIGRMIANENKRLHKTMKQTNLARLARSLDKTQLETA